MVLYCCKLVEMSTLEALKSCTVVVDDIVAIRPLEEDAEVKALPFEIVGETTSMDRQTMTDNSLVFCSNLTIAVDIFQLRITRLDVSTLIGVVRNLWLELEYTRSNLVEVFILIYTIIYISVHLTKRRAHLTDVKVRNVRIANASLTTQLSVAKSCDLVLVECNVKATCPLQTVLLAW